MRIGHWSNRTSVLVRRDTKELTLCLSLHAHTPRKGQVSEKAAICKPGKELSPETTSAGILILDFQTPKNKCLLFKPPNLWYFVMELKQLRQQDNRNDSIWSTKIKNGENKTTDRPFKTCETIEQSDICNWSPRRTRGREWGRVKFK